MLIIKKPMARRTFLRGASAAVALPMLDAMIPVFAGTNQGIQIPRRMSIIYSPNGMNMSQWTPTTTGRSYELSRSLQPLAAYRENMLVLTGLCNSAGNALPGEGETAPHERAGGVYLTGVHPQSEGVTGVSIDQIIARELGKYTQLASLELGLHSKDVAGNCEKGWSCAFMNTLSWRTSTTPLPVEYRPRAVFERLFGASNSTNTADRLTRIRKEKSILDDITAEATTMMGRVGAADRERLSEYLDGMRDVERRIQMAEQQSGRELPQMERPAGIPADFVDHLKLMFDLQILAFQTGMTRMITFMMAPEQSNRTYPQIGVPDVHHSISHHRNDPENLEKLAKIDTYHATLLTYYLDRLRATPDVDGSLFDNSMIMFGSSISDGNAHSLQNLPVVLLGGGGGKLKGGLHLRYPDKTPMANLYLTLLDKLDMPVDKFGDGNGRLDLLNVS